MDQAETEKFVLSLYEHLLGRRPSESELRNKVEAVRHHAPEMIFYEIIKSKEYTIKNSVRPMFRAGHYFSPVVDPVNSREHIERGRESSRRNIPGITLNAEKMIDLYRSMLPIIKTTPFEDEKTQNNRFYYNNGNFPYGDAIILRALIGHIKPKRVIEIGSGNSTACILDAVDHAGISKFSLTCIEPNPGRLKSLLRPSDYNFIDIMECKVQDVSLEIFYKLKAGDILFIDSTHILKSGSDVNFELFSIIPILNPGVIIHFHDIGFPFEYPKEWIYDDNKSWNEIYALRAFLMNNHKYQIIYWSSFIAQKHRSVISESFPLILKNPGSGIWIKKLSN